MNTRRRLASIGAMIAIFTLVYVIGSVNAGVSFSYNLTGNCAIKASDNYKSKSILYEMANQKEIQYSFNAVGTNSDNSSLYHSLDTAKGLETNSIFNFNYAAEGNSTEGGAMGMTENIGLTSIYSGYSTKGSGLLTLIPSSYEKINAYSELAGTKVLTATTTKVGITGDGLQYKIYAGGQKEGALANGKVSVGVSMYVVNSSDGGLKGSKCSYEEKSTASGSFEFYKVIAYTSKIKAP